MDPIIENTFKFIDKLDRSDLMNNYRHYKNILLKDNNLLKKISKSKYIETNEELISLRREIYKNNDYQKYMELYTELTFLIRNINKKYQTFLGAKKCI